MTKKHCLQFSDVDIHRLFEGLLTRDREEAVNNHVDYCLDCQMRVIKFYEANQSPTNIVEFPVAARAGVTAAPPSKAVVLPFRAEPTVFQSPYLRWIYSTRMPRIEQNELAAQSAALRKRRQELIEQRKRLAKFKFLIERTLDRASIPV